MEPTSTPLATPTPTILDITDVRKKWKLDLKFYGAYSRDSILLADYSVANLCFEKRVSLKEVLCDGEKPITTTVLSQYSYFYFSGTEKEFDDFFDLISVHEDMFKIIGIREVDMETSEPKQIHRSAW